MLPSLKVIAVAFCLMTGLRAYAAENICLSVVPGTSRCTVCNSKLNYVSNGNFGCTYVKHEKCQYMNSLGVCLKCNVGYVPVGATCKLSGMSTSTCLQYSSPGVCTLCPAGQYPTGGVCAPITTPANNCAFFDASQNCLICRAGYTLTGTGCVATNSNCFYQTNTQCVQCQPGYQLVTRVASNTLSDAFVLNQVLGAGYSYGGGFSCIPITVANCAVTRPNQPYCVTCNQGYFAVNGACVVANVPNCQILSSPTTCSVCAQGYYLTTSGCTPVANNNVNNCQYFAADGTCLRCLVNYYLQSTTGANGVVTQSCIQITANLIANCLFYSSANVCSVCAQGYYLSGNACLQGYVFVPNCSTYGANFQCLTCATNYYLTAGGCVLSSPLVANCFQYSGNNACQYCNAGYVLNGNTCVQSNAVANCLYYGANTQCVTCETNFYLDTTTATPTCRAVQTLISNCLFYATATTCLFCRQQFALTADKTRCLIYTPDLCYRMEGPVTCSYCLQGYVYDPSVNLCVPVLQNELILNCFIYAVNFNADGTRTITCFRCEQTFFLSAPRTCTPVTTYVSGCEVSANANACQYCSLNFQVNDANTACGALPTNSDINCRHFRNNVCVQCKEGFYLLSSATITNSCARAYQVISNCMWYQLDTNDTNSPQRVTPCGQCVAGYGLSASGFLCIMVTSTTRIANCAYYSTNINNSPVCLRCEAGFNLTGTNTCGAITAFGIVGCNIYENATTCRYCSPNYFLSSPTTCTASSTNNIANCFAYSQANVCQVCNSGYILSNNACLLVNTANCLYFASPTTCATCVGNYYVPLGGSACVAVAANNIIADCLFYGANGLCAACANGLVLSGNACVLRVGPIANCLLYATQTSCYQCAAGFFPQGNVCATLTQTVAQCQFYRADGICQLCNSGFLLIGNSCVSGCVALNTAGTACAACSTGLVLSSNFLCVTPSGAGIQQCYYAENGVCLICNSGYYLSSTGSCMSDATLLGSNCLIANAPQCQMCQPGFYLDQGACVSNVNSVVADCAFQASATTCGICPDTHYMDEGSLTCKPVELESCYCNFHKTWNFFN